MGKEAGEGGRWQLLYFEAPRAGFQAGRQENGDTIDRPDALDNRHWTTPPSCAPYLPSTNANRKSTRAGSRSQPTPQVWQPRTVEGQAKFKRHSAHQRPKSQGSQGAAAALTACTPGQLRLKCKPFDIAHTISPIHWSSMAVPSVLDDLIRPTRAQTGRGHDAMTLAEGKTACGGSRLSPTLSVDRAGCH